MAERYAWEVYCNAEVGQSDAWYGHVWDRKNGERVFTTVFYLTEEDAINAALDYIDNAIAEGE